MTTATKTAVSFGQDFLGNKNAHVRFPAGTEYQIVQIDESLYFGVRVAGSDWSKISRFGYLDRWWQQGHRDWRPLGECFQQVIEDFVRECDEDDDDE